MLPKIYLLKGGYMGEFKMSQRAKREYLEAIHKRYKNAKRKGKNIILTEFCHNTHYHRKHAIRKINKFKRFIKPKHKQRGKHSVYKSEAITTALTNIWLKANQPCSKNLKAIIPIWLPFYAEEYGCLDYEIIKKLKKISPATIDRLFKPIRIKYTKRGRATTKPGTLLRRQIPIKTNQWDEKRPGYLEADTVAHCGDSIAGMFAWTLDCVDIATGWTEQRAVWGKGELGVLKQVKSITDYLPFPLLGFDSDNGGEFINHHLIRHFSQKKKYVQFTRARPYHKQDNAHVEQKNWTHVRQWLGYERFDNPEVVALMNALYTSEWRLFLNFFCPSVKLLDKKLVAAKIIKCYDKPKTPYQRCLESPYVDEKVKKELKELSATLNPFKLRKAIDAKIKKIFDSL